MLGRYFTYFIIYLVIISLFAIGLTVYDKRAARLRQWRIRERTLMIVSLVGGSAAMLATMRIIRHKTQHPKFMIGIPIIIFLQVAVGFFIWFWIKKGLA
jgi:uncharacterized membrane protein YsdA (DUF1294 family)